MTGVLKDPFVLLASWMLFLMELVSPGADEGILHAGPVDPGIEDHHLMARLRSGDRGAFELLFEKWKRPLISFFYRSTGDYHQAEDLTLEVAMKVYRARKRYEPRAKFSTWLFQIAHNCLRDAWRRKRPVFLAGADRASPEWVYPEAVDTVEANQVSQWEEWLAHALKSVPRSEKTALLLVAQQGMSPAEAADVMGIKPNHLRVLLYKVRNRLKILRQETL